MQPIVENTAVSKKMLWAGRVASGLPILLILFGSFAKLAKAAAVVQGFKQGGYPERLILTIGAIELVCCVFYLIPKTRVFGAVLLTGLLGGATATNLRIGDPTFIMPVVFGVLVWGGLFLRDAQLRAVVPLRR